MVARAPCQAAAPALLASRVATVKEESAKTSVRMEENVYRRIPVTVAEVTMVTGVSLVNVLSLVSMVVAAVMSTNVDVHLVLLVIIVK